MSVRCIECGWILPAAFQLGFAGWKIKLGEPPVPEKSYLLFACGNCDAWHRVDLIERGSAKTENGEAFGNMPPQCDAQTVAIIKRKRAKLL
jgi:hypothetical protein